MGKNRSHPVEHSGCMMFAEAANDTQAGRDISTIYAE